MIKCSREGCEERAHTRTGICLKHYKQDWYLKKVGRTEKIVRTSEERWVHCVTGYVMIKVDGKLLYEHRVLAERALGRPLPYGAVIHHTGEPWDNHGPFKLVICPSQEYHMLLHRRMGHACNQYG